MSQERALESAERFQAQVSTVLEQLKEAGFLISPVEETRRVLRACTTPKISPGYDEVELYSSPRWRPSSPYRLVAETIPSSEPDRASSIPLDITGRSGAAISLTEITELLCSAYGTSTSGRKPVPSAGALWPLTVHVWIPLEFHGDCWLHWFDDENAGLHRFDIARPAAELGTWYLQPDYVSEILYRWGVLIIISVNVSRVATKYRERAVLFSGIEAGSVLQEIYRLAPSFDVNVRPLGGFYASRICDVIGTPEPILSLLLWRVRD